ncbi:MAG: hypothetical protein CND83_02335 [Rhodothermaeota bacterium MED-G19]|nr:MAG: hypothetical protein CND83_02335 [Rhodothermaeota bacterium MED-G19]
MSVLKKKDGAKVDDDKSIKSPIKKVSKESDSKKTSKTLSPKPSKSSAVNKSKNDKEKIDSNSKSSSKISEEKSSKSVAEESVEKDLSIKELSPFKLLMKKKEIIKELRVLVNGVEDKNTFNKVKDLQNKWKEIGQINDAKDKSLWTTYNALLDRFYDNRSIYFELKELDRKKNLEIKTLICDKAESLIKDSNVMRSVSKLNELHSEFKHIGPVSKEKQNEIWDRLKNASDEVYKKKKEFISNIKVSLGENLEKKTKLLDEINQIKTFKTEHFKEWNNKTREVLGLKDKWNSIGGVPKNSNRNISKEFWNSFKEFFNNKSSFFKKIDDSYKNNLKLKKDLIERVNSLKDSDQWEETSKEIQSVQKEWKKIGKVPIKDKDKIYKEFKEVCDFFYERMRLEDKDTIKIYEDNLNIKIKACNDIEQLLSSDNFNQDEFFKLQVKFLEAGHVPKEKIDEMKDMFKNIIDKVVEKSSSLMNKDDFDKFKFIIELNSLAKNPYSKNKIIKKKSDIIKKINAIQSEIKNLKNNIYYLKESVAADNLKKEYMVKINDSDKEIESLKLQLNLINKV